MKSDHHGPIVGQRGELTAIDCKSCGYIHLDKMPDPAALAAFYESSFWTDYKRGALATFEAERDWLGAINDDHIQLVKRAGVGKGTWLDVGCGYGFLLERVEHIDSNGQAYAPFGIELSNDVIAYNEKRQDRLPFPIFQGTWEQYPYDWKWDVISAMWLIEHLPNPQEFLLWCYDRLHSGGVLLVAVPSDFSAIQHEANGYVKNLFWFLDPSHINYFTPSSLSNLLGCCGFRIVERTTLYPMEQFLINGDDYTADPELGARLHANIRVEDLQMSRDERIKLYQGMASEGRGRELIYVAVKE